MKSVPIPGVKFVLLLRYESRGALRSPHAMTKATMENASAMAQMKTKKAVKR